MCKCSWAICHNKYIELELMVILAFFLACYRYLPFSSLRSLYLFAPNILGLNMKIVKNGIKINIFLKKSNFSRYFQHPPPNRVLWIRWKLLYFEYNTFQGSSAFDRQDPTLAIQKFIKKGVRPALIPVLVSYLSDRKMQVRINNTYSSTYSLPCGGPQGTLIGLIE